MDVRPQIESIEARLKAKGLSVAKLCRAADLAQTTWGRWKLGTCATAQSWARIEAAIAELAPLPEDGSRMDEAA